MSNEAKERLRVIYDEYQGCTSCKLHETRRSVVFGSGNPDADILLITDAPTEVEDRLGHHNTSDIRWVVQALKHAINKPKMPVAAVAELMFQRCFVTSAVLCRPIIPIGDKAGEYREPKWSEVKACRERLLQTIYAVDPHIVVACGKFAVQSLVGRASKLPSRTGRVADIFMVDVPGEMMDVPYSVIPSVDPQVAQRRGDYDDPNGMVAAFSSALTVAWNIADYLNNEDT
jgi:uracil-DNA glycosylase family 4